MPDEGPAGDAKGEDCVFRMDATTNWDTKSKDNPGGTGCSSNTTWFLWRDRFSHQKGGWWGLRSLMAQRVVLRNATNTAKKRRRRVNRRLWTQQTFRLQPENKRTDSLAAARHERAKTWEGRPPTITAFTLSKTSPKQPLTVFNKVLGASSNG